MDDEEEKKLISFYEYFKLNPEDSIELTKAKIIKSLLKGKKPDKLISSRIPFKLQKLEYMIWIYNDVDYSLLKTKIRYEGGYAGVSVRVAKGVYLRTAAFKGYPVKKEELSKEGIGTLGITNKHLYFFYGMKSFRIKHEKIISVQPTHKGFIVQKDGVRAMPQVFHIKDEPWFICNLLNNAENEAA